MKSMKMDSTHFLLFFFLFFSLLPLPSISTSLFPSSALPTKSGYLPISSSSSLFFAYYEAQHPLTPLSSTPLLLWVQSGLGCSSMQGNLYELGPFLVSPDAPLTLHPNPFSWNRRFGLLFIDSPLGAGFSVTANSTLIPRDQPTIAANLYAAIESFISSNDFRARPFYLTGESYAGKYIPATGYYILKKNSQLPASRRINLKGVAIGNGLTHPVVQTSTHSVSEYFTGFINEKQKAYLEQLQREAISLTLEEKWAAASDAFVKMLNWLQNATRLATFYNFTKKKPYQNPMVAVLLNNDEVKAALGVAKGVTWEECSSEVAKAMNEDLMKSVKFEAEELIKNSRVLLYQGVYDLAVGVVSTETWLKEIDWEGLESFFKAEREVWELDGELAGYVRSSGSLSHVVVNGAGHFAVVDQGARSQVMIEDWVMGTGLFSDAKK